MADWSSLKPLKTHSTIMGIVVIVLAAILILTPRHAFNAQAEILSSESSNSTSTVNAVSGLSIRNEPKVGGTLLTTAPYQAALTIIDENAASDIVGGKSGKWYKVEYQGITGYAWGNYIDK